MRFLHVDLARCSRCGRCAAVCTYGSIAVEDDGPFCAGERCLACGHCAAVCPTGALEHDKAPSGGDFPPGWRCPAPDDAAMFLRSRHSERCYLPDPVPRATIEKLLDTARYAPTGGNRQGMRFLAIDKKTILRDLVAAIYDWGRGEQAKGTRLGQLMAVLEARHREEERDTVLWDAPCLIIAAPQPGRLVPSPRDSAIFMLLYAQIYAPSLGLGTCWSGLVDAAAAARHPGVMDALRPYGDIEVAGAIMVGYPRYAYHRLVTREPLHLSWADG